MRPGGSAPRREGRVQADAGNGDPEAVRSDEPRAVRPDEREQLLLALDAFGADLGEAGGDDAQGAHALAQGRLRRLEHVLARNADDRQVDRIRDLLDRAVAADPGDRLRPSG